jgi:dinuclear metal center YbgI/SA1388 family protein
MGTTFLSLTECVDRFDTELRTDAFAGLDASANGLQVGSSGTTIERVAFAVDAAIETIEAAIEADADLLVTHHGLVWGGLDRLTGTDYDRIAPLIDGELPLYVSHLPLDAHFELGNAAGMADLLEVYERDPFGALGDEHLGTRGRTRTPISPEELAVTLDEELDTGTRGVQALDFGPDTIEAIAILTGSGADWFGEARAAGVDAFVTGEGKGKLYHEAKEAGVHVFLAGHYATETFGVRSLMGLAEKWGLETTFLDRPTGL